MHIPMDVSKTIGSIFFERAKKQNGFASEYINEFEDPGGKIISFLDQCEKCAGTGEAWEGWAICKYCEGAGLRRIDTKPSSRK